MGNRPVWIVASNFTIPEREEEWNNWYNTKHVPDVLKCPGIASGTRYRAVDPQPGQAKYIAVYEFENEEAIDKAWSSSEMEYARVDARATWPEGAWVTGLALARIYKRINP